MKNAVSFIIGLALLVIGLIIGFAVGNSKGYDRGYSLGVTNTKLDQESRSIEEIKSELLLRESQTIKEYIKGTAQIETKDEGSLFTIKYVQYLTGTLASSATLATAKDIKLKIIYFSKTNTEIGNQEITIYEYIKPGRTINFKERVNAPSQVAEFKFQIIEVSSND